MKRTWLLNISLLLYILAYSQQEIKIDDLASHIGDSVTICTKIYGGIYLDRSKDTPTLLNAGDVYPKNPLTIFIGAEARKKFREAPEVFYKDKEVCISGKLILYKEKPEIVVYEEKQIVLKN